MQSKLGNSRIIAVMQPTYFPWLGYFDLIDQSDVFILYNDVQLSKQSWQTRNRIPTANGITLISLPIKKCALDTIIKDAQIDNTKPWQKKLLRTMQLNYAKASHFEEIYGWLSALLEQNYHSLQELNSTFIMETAKKIGINTQFHFSSELNINATDRVDRLIELSKKSSCNVYLSTTGSYGYLAEENGDNRFKEHGIILAFHNYKPVSYSTGKLPFEPYMSVLDTLFHCGFVGTLEIIRAGRKSSLSFKEYNALQHE